MEIRLHKMAVQLNVSTNTLIEKLRTISNKQFNRNSKLEPEEVEFLSKVFEDDKTSRQEADKRKSTFFFDIDEDFYFKDNEQLAYPELYSEFKKCEKEIRLLRKKEKKYWALDHDEILIIMKSKFKKIFEIQEEVKIIRSSGILHESTYDPYEDFSFCGLSGEEAYVAFLNCS